MHVEKSLLAGKTVRIKKESVHFQFPGFGGSVFKVEDWWDRVSGRSWTKCPGNIAAKVYFLRTVHHGLPLDEEVLYGHTEDGYGHLVHVSEIEEV